jgi:hypothetical protein
VLNAKFGVLLLGATDPDAPPPPPAAAASEGAILELLEATVSLMVREYSAGCPYAELAQVRV